MMCAYGATVALLTILKADRYAGMKLIIETWTASAITAIFSALIIRRRSLLFEQAFCKYYLHMLLTVISIAAFFMVAYQPEPSLWILAIVALFMIVVRSQLFFSLNSDLIKMQIKHTEIEETEKERMLLARIKVGHLSDPCDYLRVQKALKEYAKDILLVIDRGLSVTLGMGREGSFVYATIKADVAVIKGLSAGDSHCVAFETFIGQIDFDGKQDLIEAFTAALDMARREYEFAKSYVRVKSILRASMLMLHAGLPVPVHPWLHTCIPQMSLGLSLMGKGFALRAGTMFDSASGQPRECIVVTNLQDRSKVFHCLTPNDAANVIIQIVEGR